MKHRWWQWFFWLEHEGGMSLRNFELSPKYTSSQHRRSYFHSHRRGRLRIEGKLQEIQRVSWESVCLGIYTDCNVTPCSKQLMRQSRWCMMWLGSLVHEGVMHNYAKRNGECVLTHAAFRIRTNPHMSRPRPWPSTSCAARGTDRPHSEFIALSALRGGEASSNPRPHVLCREHNGKVDTGTKGKWMISSTLRLIYQFFFFHF
jgi:hypothetical protein